MRSSPSEKKYPSSRAGDADHLLNLSLLSQKKRPFGSCGQRTGNAVGNSVPGMGINPPVDITPGYPQPGHRRPDTPATAYQHPCDLCKPLTLKEKSGLPTENGASIHSYIFYLLKNLFSYIFLYPLRGERKLTLSPFFSRIAGPSKGHFALM